MSSRDVRSISELRYKGYLAALADHGIPFDPTLLACTDGRFDIEAAYAGMTSLLDSGADFSAIFTLSDTFAIAAIKALHDHGRQVPEDCSVIAIDGLAVTEYTLPTLTTMIQPAGQMGRESVEILMNILENSGSTRHVRLDATLREGGSVRAI